MILSSDDEKLAVILAGGDEPESDKSDFVGILPADYSDNTNAIAEDHDDYFNDDHTTDETADKRQVAV